MEASGAKQVVALGGGSISQKEAELSCGEDGACCPIDAQPESSVECRAAQPFLTKQSLELSAWVQKEFSSLSSSNFCRELSHKHWRCRLSVVSLLQDIFWTVFALSRGKPEQLLGVKAGALARAAQFC